MQHRDALSSEVLCNPRSKSYLSISGTLGGELGCFISDMSNSSWMIPYSVPRRGRFGVPNDKSTPGAKMVRICRADFNIPRSRRSVYHVLFMQKRHGTFSYGRLGSQLLLAGDIA